MNDTSARDDHAVDELRGEVGRLRAELDDWRHNVALRAYTAPDASLDDVLASLDARIAALLTWSGVANSAPEASFERQVRERVAAEIERERSAFARVDPDAILGYAHGLTVAARIARGGDQ